MRSDFRPVKSVAAVVLILSIAAFERPAAAEDREWHADFGFEAKAHFRHSDHNRFAVNFPFTPDMLPPGQDRGFLETVDPGSHFEVSVLSLFADVKRGESFAFHAKVDLYDFYDRNPTSGDRRVDLDQAWLRFGREFVPALPAEGFGGYLKLGKFEKFERQNDRHLESYGLVSTAFNRMEDVGFEAGIDFSPNWYAKASVTHGNPLFFRDPNALAGDHGTDALRFPNPEPRYNSGIPIIYDAEVKRLDFDRRPEIGLAAGFRHADEAGRRAFDVMVFGYRGKLEDSVSLRGTFYGGDLDFLRGPFDQFPYPELAGNKREEYGVNVRAYLGGLSLFGQYVDQKIASLPRKGLELEAAWLFELPLVWAAGGQQLISHIQPAIRYSRLDNDFANPAVTPFPSGNWDWEKIDFGLRLTILPGLDLTAEYARNKFETAGGNRNNDEWLATLRWRR